MWVMRELLEVGQSFGQSFGGVPMGEQGRENEGVEAVGRR